MAKTSLRVKCNAEASLKFAITIVAVHAADQELIFANFSSAVFVSENWRPAEKSPALLKQAGKEIQ